MCIIYDVNKSLMILYLSDPRIVREMSKFTYRKYPNLLRTKKNIALLSLRSTGEPIVNQNSFRVLSILYSTNFCETRKINSNAIRALFLLLNFRKSRKCALN